AIDLAERGFTVDESLNRSIKNAAERLAKFTGSAALLLPNGQPPLAGTTSRNPELAATLKRISANGPAGFYEGETANLIVAEMQVIAEAERRAFADRNQFLGDPDFVKVPAAMMVSKQYADRQRATIDMKHATPSASLTPGLGRTAAEGAQTTHFDVVDMKGNAVAMTTTLNELYGSSVAVTGAGFFLNDEMD